MNQKQKTIALLITALVVWGYSAMEWFSYLGNDTSISSPMNTTTATFPKEFFKEEKTYIPSYQYKDPFLSNSFKTEVPVYSAIPSITDKSIGGFQNNNNKAPIVLKPVEKSKDIQYQGVIISKNKKHALLMIDNVSYIVKEGDVVNGVLIQSFNDKSMSIKIDASSEVLIKK